MVMPTVISLDGEIKGCRSLCWICCQRTRERVGGAIKGQRAERKDDEALKLLWLKRGVNKLRIFEGTVRC